MYHISKEKTGERLRKLMEINKMSVRELQEELDVDSPQAVYKWINGKAIPSLENLLTLSRLFGVPIEGLLEVEKSSEDMEEKEKLWQKSHPPVFMEHHCTFRHPMVGTSSRTYAMHVEVVARDRLRTEQGMKAAVQPDADMQEGADTQRDAGRQPDCDGTQGAGDTSADPGIHQAQSKSCS